MNFAELVTEVLSITKRPDKLADARRAVNRAVTDFCLGANFARDRDEVEVELDGALYAQSIAISDLTRFRKVEAIILPYRVRPLDHASPDKLFVKGAYSNGVCNLKDAYYIAGDNIHISQSAVASSARISYFKFPAVMTGTDTFWLADISPYMIIDKAAAEIFFNIGDDTSGRWHEQRANDSYGIARRDYAYAANYG